MKFDAYIPKKKILRKYVSILNSMLNLTEREMDILALLMEIDLNWSSSAPKNVIDTRSRRYIMQNTYVNKNNLSKHIKKYKELGVLSNVEGKRWVINPTLSPSSLYTDNKITVEFTLNLEK
jgi:CRISPR/Cas system CSM-associated protein Csm4 (group 5 of RAMP superfamily)